MAVDCCVLRRARQAGAGRPATGSKRVPIACHWSNPLLKCAPGHRDLQLVDDACLVQQDLQPLVHPRLHADSGTQGACASGAGSRWGPVPAATGGGSPSCPTFLQAAKQPHLLQRVCHESDQHIGYDSPHNESVRYRQQGCGHLQQMEKQAGSGQGGGGSSLAGWCRCCWMLPSGGPPAPDSEASCVVPRLRDWLACMHGHGAAGGSTVCGQPRAQQPASPPLSPGCGCCA